MNGTPHVKEPHVSPSEEEWWCDVHSCNADDCPNDEEDCELISMEEHGNDMRDDFTYDWWVDEERA